MTSFFRGVWLKHHSTRGFNNKQIRMFALEGILLSICFQMQQTNIWNALVEELLGPQVII